MRQGRHEALASGLGWFSIALGLAELCMTRSLARALGMEGRENLLRLYGAREMATGIALLMSRERTPWLWARVGGDAVDLATLANNGRRNASPAAMVAVAGVTAVDLCAALGTSRRRERPVFDYGERSGFPRPAAEMRGIARKATVPIRNPEAG
jgi:hypothetical protein